MLHNPESRLKSRDRQDRSATQRCARTTDKGSKNSRIYSLLSHYNEMKCELTKRNGANTVMSVFPDRNCPDGLIYCLEMDSWVLRSQNPAPHILKYMDEIEILRVPGVDSAELRVGTYGNFYTNKPGHNGDQVIRPALEQFIAA